MSKHMLLTFFSLLDPVVGPSSPYLKPFSSTCRLSHDLFIGCNPALRQEEFMALQSPTLGFPIKADVGLNLCPNSIR